MAQRRAAALLLAFALAVPLQAALVARPADAAPAPLAFVNGTQFAGTQYLVITPLAYTPTMQAVAAWKSQKGVPARVVALEDVEASYAGRDNAEKVHEFLQDVYFNGTQRALKYVVLGGGSALMPLRYLHVNGSAMNLSYADDDVLSDIYFAGLSNDWDGDRDGVYGEVGEEDWDAEVFVGRFPFNSLAEAGFMRDNLLTYEKAPFVGAWMQSAAAFAAVMDPPNKVTTPNDYAWWEDNAIRSIWNTQAYLPPTMTLDLLADYYELDPGNYTPAQDRLSNASMVASVNAGKSVVMSVSHGWVPSGRGIPEYRGSDGIAYSWGDGLVYQNASSFQNFGMLPFGYISSCIVGDFSNPTLPTMARYVVQDNHGFIAEIVPTDGTLRGEDDFNSLGIREGNWWQSENYWKNFFNGTDPFRPGPALYQGIRDYSAHIIDEGRDPNWGGYLNQKAVYNLLGDPEVPIWTAVAQNLNATLPATVYKAESHFRATFKDLLNRPAAGATVAITGLNINAVATTDAQGRVDMVISPDQTGSLTVTVTLHNFVPFIGAVSVVTAPADLSISPANVSLPSAVLRTGVDASVNFSVRNVGDVQANTTEVRVVATPPAGLPQVVVPALSLGLLLPGGQAQGSFNWTPPDDGLWSLQLIVDPGDVVNEFDELNNEAVLSVSVSSVDLAFAAGSVTLNPPGQVAPGGVLEATGAISIVGLVPRSYLVGYELLRGDRTAASAGNTALDTTGAAFTLDIPAPEPGEFTLRLTVDAGGDVLEFDEANNLLEFPVRAGAGPSVFALPSITLNENAPPTRVIADLSLYIADPDTPYEQLTLTTTPSAPELAVWVDGKALIVHPPREWSGAGTIEVRAFDGHESGAALASFTVIAHNGPPTILNPGAQESTAGELFRLEVNASDPEGGPLDYSLFAAKPGGAPQLLGTNTDGRFAVVFPPELAGPLTLTAAVLDDLEQGASVSFPAFVHALNHAPALIDLGYFEVRRGENASFRLAATDADGDPVRFDSNSTRATVFPDGLITFDRAQSRDLPEGESVIPVTVSDGLNETSGFVRVRVVEASAAAGAYGTDLTVTLTALAAVVAAGAAVVWTTRRRPDAP